MAFFEVKNVKISGISGCVPRTLEENKDLSLFQNDEAEKFMTSTGVRRRRIADENTTASDLCYHAAEQLIADLGWVKDEIDCLVFVTQTPDYILPATSCILQHRLALSQECHAMDVSLGCSGWIYGVSVVTSFLQSGSFRKALLLVGDTSLRSCSTTDKSTWPLFGDAGTAVAFEYTENSESRFLFHTSTDGSGYDAIIIPEGGYRAPFTANSLELEKIEEGIERNKLHTVLNGMDVFSFGIANAPDSIEKLTQHFQIDKENVDLFVFHQANLFMNEKIRKKLKIPVEKVPYSLENFGNTSSATIPLTLVTEKATELSNGINRIVACGFGVGLSWGSVYFETENIVCSNLVEI
ncbi:MAG: ketoacyl-ACP synthase III [Bacteroidales bacterium]|nr:ketoacyl-ACP synthase III [Bacteroidales bacterium]